MPVEIVTFTYASIDIIIPFPNGFEYESSSSPNSAMGK